MSNDEWAYVIISDFQSDEESGYNVMTAFKKEIDADKYLVLLQRVNAALPLEIDQQQDYRIQKVKLN